jgi:hypothetical protein
MELCDLRDPTSKMSIGTTVNPEQVLSAGYPAANQKL